MRTEGSGTLRFAVNSERGLFGPKSVTWKVHAHPVLIVGGLRALMIQALHPLAMAGVAQYSDFRSDPLRRLRGTARYVHAVTFGDAATARAAADRVKRIHLAVRGTDPVTGRRFAASDPELLLWVHCVEVHSFLAGVRAYGYRLSAGEQDRYLAEQVAAAELIGIPRDRVPDSRATYRAYFAEMLPRLCTSAEAAATIDFVRRPSLPDRRLQIAAAPALRVLGQAATALVPRSLRPIAGVPEPGPGDLPARAAVVVASRALLESRRLPWLGWRIEAPMRRALLGVGGYPQAARAA
jgi:uncharacterized protein (DUF2236 family)